MSSQSCIRVKREIDGELVEQIVWKPTAEIPNLRKVEDLLPGNLLEFEVICSVE